MWRRRDLLKPAQQGPSSLTCKRLPEHFQAFWNQLQKSEYDHIHHERYVATVRRIEHLVRPGMTVVELGDKSRIAEFFEIHFKLPVATYEKDLRWQFELESSAYDMILMLEVLEHLNDRITDTSSIMEVAVFSFSGARNAFAETFRCLAPGGCLVVSTPNAISLDAIGQLLLGYHPFQYEPHVREYAPRDVIALAEQVGFLMESWSTFFAWNPLPGINRNLIADWITKLRFDASNRGDDAFFVFRKPAAG
jgi:SAM-dependent methyltransferase